MTIFRLLPQQELITDIQELLFPILEESGNKKSISNLNDLTKNKWTHLQRSHRYRGDIAIPISSKYRNEKNSDIHSQITGATVINKYYETIPITLYSLDDNIYKVRIPAPLDDLDKETICYSDLKQAISAVYPAIKRNIDMEYYFNHITEIYDYIDETYSNYEVIITNNTYYTITALTETLYLAVKANNTPSNQPVYLINMDKNSSKQIFTSQYHLLNHIKTHHSIKID